MQRETDTWHDEKKDKVNDVSKDQDKDKDKDKDKSKDSVFKTRQMIRLDLSVAIRVLRIAGWCLVSDKHTLIWTRLGVFQTSDHLHLI